MSIDLTNVYVKDCDPVRGYAAALEWVGITTIEHFFNESDIELKQLMRVSEDRVYDLKKAVREWLRNRPDVAALEAKESEATRRARREMIEADLLRNLDSLETVESQANNLRRTIEDLRRQIASLS